MVSFYTKNSRLLDRKNKKGEEKLARVITMYVNHLVVFITENHLQE